VAPKTSIQQLYGELWADENPLDSELERSLEPRGTEWLFAAFASLGPQRGQLVVDIGARDAGHTIRLVREHGLRAIALDPVRHHVELADRAVSEAGLESDIEVLEAGIEAMPIADGTADWIWCRDVLVHVDLARGVAECARILRPGGQMLAYVTCATDLLEPSEAAALFGALAVVPESTQPDALGHHAAAAGLTLVSCTPLGGEWREWMIEEGLWDPGSDLLRLSRLHRREAELIERHGATPVAAFAAARVWGVYQLLGKLCPTIYVWRLDA
jgi:ubiquinone/menaquinone biosynthesis C-methylase UbiE